MEASGEGLVPTEHVLRQRRLASPRRGAAVPRSAQRNGESRPVGSPAVGPAQRLRGPPGGVSLTTTADPA